ncbi:T9SS type A sorting domain-containing protein [Chryseobacterium sp.]|uniref:T9SS type A sorting domain-containing protein n=1 Tax=Chryseobacterium sp. TaxID=1871047 RepID=UPI0032EDD652
MAFTKPNIRNPEDGYHFAHKSYNIVRQLVKKSKFNNKQTNISELSTGTYLIRINKSESIVKIIKQ